MKSYSKVMRDNFLADLANLIMLRPVYRQSNNQEKVTTMADLSITRKDILNRAAQAAAYAEQARTPDTRTSWAETARAWVDIANAMYDVAETVTITF